MPPRTRTRGTKALKENSNVENNIKNTGKILKPPRKVLADKTNSLSDDNTTVNEIKKTQTKLSLAIENNGRPRREKRLPARFKENRVLSNLSANLNSSTNLTTRKSPINAEAYTRDETSSESLKKVNSIKNIKTDTAVKILETQHNDVLSLKDGSKSQNSKSFNLEKFPRNTKVTHIKKGKTVTRKKHILVEREKQLTPTKDSKPKAKDTQKSDSSDLNKQSPNISKTSNKINISDTFTPPSDKEHNSLEKSLVINRPKRIHRLPSRFDDHSISPNKFIPVQPCHASTPLQKKHPLSAKQSKLKQPISVCIKENKDNSCKSEQNKTSPDSNNNPKTTRLARLRVKNKTSPVKTSKYLGTGLLDKSLSFKILDNKKSIKKGGNLDIYEFTFDPDEEPQPEKKKKKRIAKKKQPRPKIIVSKNNYEKNISKAMAALKDAVAKYEHPKDGNYKKITVAQNKQNKPQQTHDIKSQVQRRDDNQNNIESNSNAKPQKHKIVDPTTKIDQPQKNRNQITPLANNSNKLYENLPSIRVEDIEADCEISYHDDINYSPVNSPRPSSLIPMAVTQHSNADDRQETIERAIHNKDPLNLQDDISFFDDLPVASSSMNVSVRHPLASPWRVEFGSLPIKWQANTYLKPNMTPAVENSFISSEESNKKKHVYVNIIAQNNESLPQIVENDLPNLKQTSIISFIKEVAERNAKKKKEKPDSPVKTSTLFEDITNKHLDKQKIMNTSKKATNKAVTEAPATKNASNLSSDTSSDKENVRVTRKRKNENTVPNIPAKSPRKDKNVTYFGFDDSENQDQENILPNRNIDDKRVKALRSRPRVLQEINGHIEPTSAVIPLAAKTKITSNSEAVKRIYEELKSAEDAPQFLEKNDQENSGTTKVNISQNEDIESDEGESMHLFEDFDVVHHIKPTRKSYGKVKKVTFRKNSISDSETQVSDVDNNMQSSDEDDRGDFTFTMPEINQKKTVKKKKTKKMRSKKEEKEAEEWAAGFNSMCEDIDDFPLVVE